MEIHCPLCGKPGERAYTYRRCMECHRAIRKSQYQTTWARTAKAAWQKKYRSSPEFREKEKLKARKIRLRQAEDKKATTPPNPNHRIYFIRDKTSRAVKIGFTHKPVKERLDHLQNGNPRRLVIVVDVPGTCFEEKQLHHRFRQYRIRREWFREEGELREYIQSLISPMLFA